jgi:hypothetical protein
LRISQPQWPLGWRRQLPVGPPVDPSGHRRLGIFIAGPQSSGPHGSAPTACGVWSGAESVADPDADPDAGSDGTEAEPVFDGDG